MVVFICKVARWGPVIVTFSMKDKFEELLSRYVMGRCTEAEIRVVDQWFEDIVDQDLELPTHEQDEVEAEVLKKILAVKKKQKNKDFVISLGLKAAASLALLVVVGYLWFRTDYQQVAILEKDQLPELELENEITNSGELIQKIILPDSSRVELSPGSVIRYDKRWTGPTREVYLTGEAFFDVRKNPEHPFLVYSGSVVTRVLGTSFSVSAPAGSKSVEVMVRTGKVSVHDNAQRSNKSQIDETTDGVILTPNEKVKYYIEHKHWVTGLIDKPQPVIIEDRDRDFIFSDTPLKDIINHIAEYYQIEVIVENDAAVNCSFTGDVSKMELHDMLTIICESIGTRYEVKGSKILVTGNGCEP